MKSKFLFFIAKPFLNLTPRARVLMSLRLGMTFLALIGTILLIVLPYLSHDVFVAKLSCTHADVSNGLFSTLTDSVNGDVAGSILTTSEIELFVSYVENEVKAAPQVITSNLMNWCFGSYNATETYDHSSDQFFQSERIDLRYQCTKTDLNYVFDYRGELSTIGLNILLAYAYTDRSEEASDRQVITSSTTQYIPDSSYLDLLQMRRKVNKVIVDLFFASIGIQFCVLFFGVLYYGNRGLKKDDQDMPTRVKNTFGAFSTLAFVCVTCSVLFQTVTMSYIERDANDELGDFGVKVHRGHAWISLGWTTIVLALVAAGSWGGPIWCGEIEERVPVELKEEERAFMGTPITNRRTSTFKDSISDSDDTRLLTGYINDSQDSIELATYTKNPKRKTSRPSFKESTRVYTRSLTQEERHAKQRSLSKLLKPDDATKDIVLNEDSDFIYSNGEALFEEESCDDEYGNRPISHATFNPDVRHAETETSFGGQSEQRRQVL